VLSFELNEVKEIQRYKRVSGGTLSTREDPEVMKWSFLTEIVENYIFKV